MSDPKRQAKRATRAERRAAEAAAQQAQAEQAAKERKQQTIIGCILHQMLPPDLRRNLRRLNK